MQELLREAWEKDSGNLREDLAEAQESCEEGKIIGLLSIPEELRDDAAEIIFGLYEYVEDAEAVAFVYLDEILYARIYDGERYLFPLPFMLTDTADSESALINLAEYSVREMVPLIITDVPRDELDFIMSVFPHVDASAYEEDEDTFFIKVNNECDMLCEVPGIEVDGIALNEITDADKDVYAELCRDRNLNKYWGYDVDADNPDGDADFYLATARRELEEGIAIALAIRENGEFVGEATVYGFDYRGGACIAVRVLPRCHSRGIGSRAVKALISLARELELATLRAEILNENVASIRMTSKLMDLEKSTESKTYFTLSL